MPCSSAARALLLCIAKPYYNEKGSFCALFNEYCLVEQRSCQYRSTGCKQVENLPLTSFGIWVCCAKPAVTQAQGWGFIAFVDEVKRMPALYQFAPGTKPP
jgi:hypothetical protein